MDQWIDLGKTSLTTHVPTELAEIVFIYGRLYPRSIPVQVAVCMGTRAHYLNGLPCLAGKKSLHYIGNRSPHGNCEYSAVPSARAIFSAGGELLGLTGPTFCCAGGCSYGNLCESCSGTTSTGVNLALWNPPASVSGATHFFYITRGLQLPCISSAGSVLLGLAVPAFCFVGGCSYRNFWESRTGVGEPSLMKPSCKLHWC